MNHGQLFRAESGDVSLADVAGVLTDKESSPLLNSADRAMLDFAEKLTFNHEAATREDIEKLRAVGFSDENILDIIASVAYRNYSNRLNLAIGIEDGEFEGPAELLDAIRAVRSAGA